MYITRGVEKKHKKHNIYVYVYKYIYLYINIYIYKVVILNTHFQIRFDILSLFTLYITIRFTVIYLCINKDQV